MAVTLDTLKQKQALLRILVFSFVTVLIWIGFSVFRSQQSTGISPELQKLAVPLNPNIDMTVIQRIEQKRAYSDQELASFPILKVKSQTASNTITTSPNGTPVSGDLSALINNPNLLPNSGPSPAPSSGTTPTNNSTPAQTPQTGNGASQVSGTPNTGGTANTGAPGATSANPLSPTGSSPAASASAGPGGGL